MNSPCSLLHALNNCIIMIRTVNLNKVFRTEEVETRALNDVNLHFQKGEFVAIMEPSGCGKSTLLNQRGGQKGFVPAATCQADNSNWWVLPAP